MTRRALLVAAVAVAVAVAFADSSIVVLALPELYARFDTTIEGVAWVITSYNLVLAICALALVVVVHHARATCSSPPGPFCSSPHRSPARSRTRSGS